MTDLEQRLRRELREEVDRFPSEIPDGAPGSVRRKVRLRQVTSIGSMTIVAAALATLVLLGRGVLENEQPSHPAESPDAPHATETRGRMTLVAEGSFEGNDWQYYLYRNKDGDWCDDLDTGSGGGGGCGPAGVSQGHWSIGYGGEPFIVTGWVPEGTATLVFDTDEGERIEGAIYSPPQDLGAPHDVFVLGIPRVRLEIRGYLRAIDENGAVLLEHRLDDPDTMPPLPPPEERTLLGSGSAYEDGWAAYMFEREGQTCIGLVWGQGSGATCGFQADDPMSASGDSFGFSSIFGHVSRDASEIRFDLQKGRSFEGQIIEPPAEMGLGFNVYVVFYDQMGKGQLVALNDQGHEVARIDWPRDWPPGSAFPQGPDPTGSGERSVTATPPPPEA